MARKDITKQKQHVRFWAKVNLEPGLGPNGDCWEWTGAITESTGYGKYKLSKTKTIDAHRYVLVHVRGLDMKGLVVRHLCHNRKCVKPEHLKAGTHKENTQDAIERGTHNPLKVKPRRGEENNFHRLTETEVIAIRLRVRLGASRASLADLYGVTKDCIHKIIQRRTWKHL